MLSFLPYKIKLYIDELDFSKLYEVRLRQSFPVKVKIDEQIKKIGNGQVVCTKEDIEQTIKSITEYSMYAYNESLKKGFITTKSGVRVGVAGECVFDKDKIITIKNISSLNVRVPHLIEGCAKGLYKHVLDNKINNLLIISPPFFGKTTLLKDLIIMLDKSQRANILVVDERNEFSSLCGENIDIIKLCDKEYAFSCGIRSLSPDVIITDELIDERDWRSVKKAILSGVKVLASCHGESIENLKNNNFFINGLFDRYVVLDSNCGKAGIISKIYDGNLNLI